MKAIMISVKPEWCRKILNKDKTLELRTTCPKEWKDFLSGKTNVRPEPTQVYIYCTKIKDKKRYTDEIDIPLETEMYMGNGRVIAEFTLDGIAEFYVFENGSVQGWNWFGLKRSCLTYEQIAEYIGLNKKGYAWHIDDLKIYDEPKELNEFEHYISNNRCPKKENGMNCEDCKSYNKEHNTCLALYYLHKQVKRPPQSWCYVEELREGL